MTTPLILQIEEKYAELELGMFIYIYITADFVYYIPIAQILTEENIDGLTSFRSFDGKMLTDSLLDNLYLLYN